MNRKIMGVILIVLLVISPVVVMGELWSNPGGGDFEVWEDYEDGNQGISDCTGISTRSFEGNYSCEVYDTQQAPNVGFTINTTENESFYTRVNPGAAVSRLQFGNTIALRFAQNGDAIDLRSAGDTLGTVQTPEDWYDIHWTTHGTTHEIYVWESGTEKPDEPQLVGTDALAGDQTDEEPMVIEHVEVGRDHPLTVFDEFGKTPLTSFEISGSTSDSRGSALNNVEVSLTDSGEVISSDISENGRYSISASNGTYEITAEKPGYTNVTEDISVNGDSVNRELTLREKSLIFNFNSPNWMDYDTEIQYSSTFDTGGQIESVTDNTTVTSDKPTVVSVNESTNTLISTDNESISERANITASYERNGENYTVETQITVANRTMENIEIMPPSQYIPTALGLGEEGTTFGIGSEIQWVLLSVFIGSAAAWIARNEWVGVGIIIGTHVFFWVLGNISLGITMVAVFYGLMAAYQLNKIPGRSDTNVGGNQDSPPPQPPQQ